MNFDDFSLQSVLRTAVETIIIFWFTIIILRQVSSRVFSQTSPEYLLFLLLLASGMYSGIAGKDPSIWNSLATGIALLFSVFIINKVPSIEKYITGKSIVLMENGELKEKAMKRVLIDKDDLNKMAREYGLKSYESFDTIVLEKNGQLTGSINFKEFEHLRIGKKL